MEFQDKVLKCVDCGADFIFTAGEQLFFHDKQFKNEPKRCKACKPNGWRCWVPHPAAASPITKSKPKRFARSAARKPPYPSDRLKADQSSVGNVFNSGDRLQPPDRF